MMPSAGVGAGPSAVPSLTSFDNTPVAGEVLDLQKERDMVKKAAVREQQRVLEVQIEENKRRLDEERLKRQREEEDEQAKLDRERVEMAQAFEKEEQEAVAKAEADLQLAQMAQAEAKRQEKAEAARKEQEAEREADEKARREADELYQKEQEELAREAGLRGGRGPGDTSPFKIDPDKVPQNRGQPGRRGTSPISSPSARSPRSYRSNGESGRRSDRSNTDARLSQDLAAARDDARRGANVPPLNLRLQSVQSPNQSIYDGQNGNPALLQQDSVMVSGAVGAGTGAARGLFDAGDYDAAPVVPEVTHMAVNEALSSSQNLNDAIVLQLQNEAKRAKREADDAREELRRLQEEVEHKKTVDLQVRRQADEEQRRLAQEEQEQRIKPKLRPDSGILRVLEKQNEIKVSARAPPAPLSPPLEVAAARRPVEVWSANRPTRLDNVAKDEFARLDNTLQSDSRFVYPDGTDFRQSINGQQGNGHPRPMALRAPSSSALRQLPLPEPVPALEPPRQRSLMAPIPGPSVENAPSVKYRDTDRERESSSSGLREPSSPRSPVPTRVLERLMLGGGLSEDRVDETPREVQDAYREVEKINRKNLRKWGVLKNFDAESESVEALSLLMGDLEKVQSSRPSTADSSVSGASRPSSQYHNYIHHGKKGRENGGLGPIDPFGGMQPLMQHQQAAGAGPKRQEQEQEQDEEEDEEDLAAARARLRAKQAKEQAAKNILMGGTASPPSGRKPRGHGSPRSPRATDLYKPVSREKERVPLAWEKAPDRPVSGYSRASSRGTNYSDFGL